MLLSYMWRAAAVESPHEHCPFSGACYHSLSDRNTSLREMAWKRSSVRSRPGPPLSTLHLPVYARTTYTPGFQAE